MHITNYQNRYFGGAAMIRLYHFDLARNTIDVETISPWILAQPPERAQPCSPPRRPRLTTPVDYFSIPIDFEQRFSGVRPGPDAARPGRPREMLIPGTLAYWRFDAGGANGTPFTASQTVRDLSGHGNDLSTLVTVPGSAGNALTWSERLPPRPAGARQPVLRRRPEPAARGVPDHGGRRPR